MSVDTEWLIWSIFSSPKILEPRRLNQVRLEITRHDLWAIPSQVVTWGWMVGLLQKSIVSCRSFSPHTMGNCFKSCYSTADWLSDRSALPVHGYKHLVPYSGSSLHIHMGTTRVMMQPRMGKLREVGPLLVRMEHNYWSSIMLAMPNQACASMPANQVDFVCPSP